MYNTSHYDYFLPEELIAQSPLEKRDQSRLMVLHRETGLIEHRNFSDLLLYLKKGDTLVVNETKVLPARLFGERQKTGAKIEVLLLKQLSESRWEVLVKPGKKAKIGEKLIFKNKGRVIMDALVTDNTAAGGKVLQFNYKGNFLEVIDAIGTMPLPPYIKEQLKDKDRYQTIYARQEGSAAAPTAGLHFTPELIAGLQQEGIQIAKILLHVGLGTFRPVQTEDVRRHQMHEEYYQVTPQAADIINRNRKQGGRIIAVGTTSVRTLETVADSKGEVQAGSGWTDIFIYPGYKFKCVDCLITNFHLPKSTLLMLVSALAGRDKVLEAYGQAVQHKYRFFSFGDAMLII
ncbi:tRNA preQ1(34) S-adenosylmethionine ribosyltransferase-isomerase QueA [Desulfofalx alkaliphila]|uniref:tRNA preQ1(34) S-adenosylmethionine ribosyltransferase-isomerase QueA n=1 Tax=Desulfofalx alkaliphila TaxID=105483 RepID=UPI0004E1E652|nr:tRNA preQ1(34) S-adenosylmethionine ribosyltransferase-isomerase QueA [Desulfofalx alkaliphila]